ncbi:GNAT family N-acetyltransferase [Nocardioides sp. KIGAM211]|uniref:GNAT family N-acetyltransferase n=1 Tax=Nocardioides luti TaxID=2761101 RepID=A0A7X0VCN8_9ACTN|nr:GNAT family N-acetyltransferase [Nocardioides luti]MBB6629232.1 GNAT family N-acetyltransferase [Nocardioides luti]
MSYDVRRATREDLAALQSVELSGNPMFDELFGPTGWGAPTGAERAAQPGFVLVAGDPPVGFAHVLDLEGTAHLEQLSVLPDLLRQGIGSALVRAAQAEAAARGHAALSLCTYRDVPWNAPFYRTLGFVEAERLTPLQRRLRDHEHDAGLDRFGVRVVMVAPLAGP